MTVTEMHTRTIEFSGVSKLFSTGTLAVDDVSFTASPGDFVTVVGPSGCGKSTLLRMAAGLSAPTEGTVDVGSARLGYVFQDPTLLPWRSVRSNVELTGELRGVPRAERRQRAQDAIDLVGLTGFEKQLPGQLSGGMKMRVSIARALAGDPDVMLFDEPFGALDEITRLAMQVELQRIVAETGVTALFITHSVSEAVYLSTRVVVMSSRPGRIVAEVEVPFDYPRPPALRYEPAFTEITATVSSALEGGHR
ncbi:ABC transporter ATP-binding protein [Actinomycetes bacterium M1A6_2h]